MMNHRLDLAVAGQLLQVEQVAAVVCHAAATYADDNVGRHAGYAPVVRAVPAEMLDVTARHQRSVWREPSYSAI